MGKNKKSKLERIAITSSFRNEETAIAEAVNAVIDRMNGEDDAAE